jgi:hypothetical protein
MFILYWIPAFAGMTEGDKTLDSRLRGNDRGDGKS